MIFKLIFVLFSGLVLTSVFGQTQSTNEYPVVEFKTIEDYEKINLTQKQIDEMSKASKSHLLLLNDKVDPEDIELKGVQVVLPRTTLFPPTPQAQSAKLALKELSAPQPFKPCFKKNSNGTDLSDLTLAVNNIIEFTEDEKMANKKFNPGQIYFMWGYNRSWHGKSDATFNTPDGTFTVYETQGRDRPSTKLKDYITPSHFLIPQYNVRIGYQLNPSWSIEVGMDHMKWVFDNQLQYRIEGDYNRTVFIRDPNDIHNLFGLNFDQVKELGTTEWLNFEHTDGYNYVFTGGLYKHNLSKSRNGKLSLDALGGIGAGLMIPQTTVSFHQDDWWNFDRVDNQFHVAGYGGHAEARLRGNYKRMFTEASARYTLIKIENALVHGSGTKLEHSPISSIQLVGTVGFYLKDPNKKNKTKPKFSP